jgi:hypothetical protein
MIASLPLQPMGKPLTLIAVGLLALPTVAVATPWRDELAVAALFRDAGVDGTFVLMDERRGELRGHNRMRAERRFSPASTFKIANALIGLSLGAVGSVDELIPYTGDANPFMREWLEPMGLRGAMKVSNVPLYQELARRIGLVRMGEAIRRLHYGNEQIGTSAPSGCGGLWRSARWSRPASFQAWPTSACRFPAAPSSKWPKSPGWTRARAGASMPKPAGRTPLVRVWAGGWAGCRKEIESRPLRSISPWPAPPMPPKESSSGAPACGLWGSCQRRQGGLSLRHEARFMNSHCYP